ncbi:hypothetical protein COT87_02680, partial [Candidatus Collierbacteria bacterium CG10_big_fil_rev_8_21_14_0_10_44_9]
MYRISYRGDNNLDKIGRLKPKYVNNHPFGGYKLSRAEIAEIKRVSPNTKVILYRSGVELFNPTGITQYGPIEWATTGEQAFAESQTSTADWQDIWQNHKNWLAKDKNGKYIHRQDGWAFAQPGVAYLANIGNPGYQQWLADWVKEKITVDGFDGVYFDLMYPGYFNGGWRCFDYKPCFPVYNGISTSQQLESQWRTWEIRLVTHIRSKLKKDPATENGIIFLNAILGITDFKDQNGIQYLKDTNPDGITFDGWRIMETDQWEDGVKLLNNISKNGLYSVPLANIHDKVWSQDEAQRVYQFYLSSFLLAYHNNSALRIRLKIKQNAGDTKGKPKYYLTEIADFFTTNNLGQPQAEYAKSSNGVYSRAFTNSLVVVNPSNQNKTFIVDQKYINAFFHDLSYVAGASITLPPQSGTV